ncbi:MAG: pyruvate dehydrogenase (acetyl-transferring) E1 component subunit alpha [Thermoplasmatota archaeon]
MPITTAYATQEIPYVSILDENGKVDKKLEPKVDDETLLKLYRTMVLSREFDHRRLKLQRQGRIGTFAPAHGQEACQAGTISQITKDDWFCPAFRESVCNIWLGADLTDDLLYCAGFEEGMNIPDDLKATPICIPIGTQYTHALGCSWGEKLNGTKNIAITYGGDGSTSEGDFHEAINMAGAMDIGVVFVIQNNQWAISVPREKQTRSQTIAQKAIAYGLEGMQVDGNDILAVIYAARKAVAAARKGKSMLLELVTYRMNVHTTADDPKKYRSKEEEESWIAKDPITRFHKYLVAKKLWNDDMEEDLQAEVKQTIDDAIERFEIRKKELSTPDYMFANAYIDEPPYLARQRKEMMAHFDTHGLPEGGH